MLTRLLVPIGLDQRDTDGRSETRLCYPNLDQNVTCPRAVNKLADAKIIAAPPALSGL